MVFEVDVNDEDCWSGTSGTIRRFSMLSFSPRTRLEAGLRGANLPAPRRGKAFDRGAQTGSKLLMLLLRWLVGVVTSLLLVDDPSTL